MPITLIPTSHVAQESVVRAKKEIAATQPACVALELDALRLQHLLHPQQGHRTFSLDALLLWLMKKLQESIGKQLGILPGSDMLAALQAAHEHGIRVFLIDQDIRITATRMQQIGWKEKSVLLLYLLTGFGALFSRFFKRCDVSTVPSERLIQQALKQLQKQFPRLYRVLLTERNQVMASRLKQLEQRYGSVMAFVGAGHKHGIQHFLKPEST